MEKHKMLCGLLTLIATGGVIVIGPYASWADEPIPASVIMPAMAIETGAVTETVDSENPGGSLLFKALGAMFKSKADAPEDNDPRAVASHQQASLIKVTNQETGSYLPIHAFCLDAKDNILTGVGDKPGEVRILDPKGKFIGKWNVPVKVEAIGCDPDGSILVGGNGRLLKLDGQGQILIDKEAPHVVALKQDAQKIRETVIQQHKARAISIKQQIEAYEQRVQQVEAKIKELAASTENGPLGQGTGRTAGSQLARQKVMLRAFRNGLDSLRQQSQQAGDKELTEVQIKRQVEAMIDYKRSISSISAANGDVYVTCSATTGYGFDVWRMDDKFENGERIVTELRGCCGQMDAQAGPAGLFVAENGRHRVCRYDRSGKMTASWGKGSRKGLEGFGGCCNPKNVTFGPGGEVYTVEDTNGRIKRYSTDGKLLGLVGTAQIGQGCLDISVAVSETGDRVYMLDTDQNQIVMLTRRPPKEPLKDSAETLPDNSAAAPASTR